MSDASETGSCRLLQLPAELVTTILRELNGASLVMLEATCSMFRSVQHIPEQKPCSLPERVAAKKVQDLRRQLGLYTNPFAR